MFWGEAGDSRGVGAWGERGGTAGLACDGTGACAEAGLDEGDWGLAFGDGDCVAEAIVESVGEAVGEAMGEGALAAVREVGAAEG